jgi:hypothetical protein
MLVREAERNGDPALSEAFTKHLHSFFQSHRG